MTSSSSSARLLDRWVFWLDKWEVDKSTNDAVQSLTDLGEADNARVFWNYFNGHPVDGLVENSSLQIFKRQVKPEWEDPANINGGHFRFTPLTPQASSGRLFYALVTSAVGGQFTLSSSVCGVGYSNKGSRKIVSVWINTTTPSVIRALQTEISAHTMDKFATKFISHKDLSRSDFQAQESVWHRRTKSAPSQYVSVDFDDDDDNSDVGAAGTEGGFAKRRAVPMPLDSKYIRPNNSNTASGDHSSAVDSNPLSSAASPYDERHLRSKSEGLTRDIVPHVHALTASSRSARQSPPPNPTSGTAAGLPERSDTTENFNWSDPSATDLRDSNSGVYPTAKAPTPMKEWADQWSPSLLNAALQRQLLPSELASQTTSPGAGQADAQSTAQLLHLVHANDAFQQHQQHQHQHQHRHVFPQDQHSPMNLSSTQHPHAMLAAFAPHLSRPVDGAQAPSSSSSSRPPAVNAPPFYPAHHVHHQHHHQQHQSRAHLSVPMAPYPQVRGPHPGVPPHLHVHHHHHLMAHHHHHHHLAHNPYQVYPPAPFVPNPPAPHLAPSALPGAQPLPYVIVRQPVTHHAPPNENPSAATPPPSGGKQGRAAHKAAELGTATAPPPPTTSASQHTRSDAPAFIFKGWKYPSGLNRKERRRIMFSDEVIPAEYPGATFVGADKPDGNCDEEGNPLQETPPS